MKTEIELELQPQNSARPAKKPIKAWQYLEEASTCQITSVVLSDALHFGPVLPASRCQPARGGWGGGGGRKGQGLTRFQALKMVPKET